MISHKNINVIKLEDENINQKICEILESNIPIPKSNNTYSVKFNQTLNPENIEYLKKIFREDYEIFKYEI